jgi:hypothetical protein
MQPIASPEKQNLTERAMRQFIMTVMALTAFGAMMATAQADARHGGPTKNGNQWFKYSPGRRVDARFGYWAECPQAASRRASAPVRLLPSDLKGPDRQLLGREASGASASGRSARR